MKARTTPNASVEKTEKGYLLRIPEGDSSSYRFAQIDDYFGLPRRKFPHHSLTLSLRAKTSSSSLPGTWGFGLWNDPFGMSLGFGGRRWQFPALPNAIWFFGASEENYLSFTSGGRVAPRSLRGVSRPPLPGNGFLAQTFRSPKFHPLLILAGLVFPFSRKLTRKILGRVIEEDAVALWNAEARFRNSTSKLVNSRIDPTQWHGYRLEWSPRRAAWYVDDALVFESPVSPNPLLGLVIWIDNQYAAFTPEGKIGFGVLENPEPAWLEIENLKLM